VQRSVGRTPLLVDCGMMHRRKQSDGGALPPSAASTTHHHAVRPAPPCVRSYDSSRAHCPRSLPIAPRSPIHVALCSRPPIWCVIRLLSRSSCLLCLPAIAASTRPACCDGWPGRFGRAHAVCPTRVQRAATAASSVAAAVVPNAPSRSTSNRGKQVQEIGKPFNVAHRGHIGADASIIKRVEDIAMRYKLDIDRVRANPDALLGAVKFAESHYATVRPLVWLCVCVWTPRLALDCVCVTHRQLCSR
jgi:hypothetical protein